MFLKKRNKNQLSKREIKLLDKGTCPDCKSKNSLDKEFENLGSYNLMCKECSKIFIVIEQIVTTDSVEFKKIHNQRATTRIIERV